MRQASNNEAILQGLCSIEPSARLAALRQLKNVVIGDKRKKSAFVKLGALPLLVEILSAESDSAALIQAAAAVRARAPSGAGAGRGGALPPSAASTSGCRLT